MSQILMQDTRKLRRDYGSTSIAGQTEGHALPSKGSGTRWCSSCLALSHDSLSRRSWSFLFSRQPLQFR